MRVRFIVFALVTIFAASAATASAQMQTGEIFGKVTDQSNAVLPGVIVTLTGPVLLQPLTAVTGQTGTFQFPRVGIGTYSVKFELTGFRTMVREGIVVTVGFSAAVSIQMGISTVQETVTVTGESPIVDTKSTGTKQTFTNELLQSIPSARDPWVILQQTAGIAMDRENIGGNMSGQQSNYISRGGNPTNNKWSLDGVDVTDMAATGGSANYYDFDAFEEMTITTGGVDVTQQTGGVGINLVTKSGTDRFRGSSRYYVTDQKFESQNITDAQRTQGSSLGSPQAASSGNPIQNIKDYGVEMGGPLKKGKAWVWGAFGKQLVDVGVLGFYQPTAACLAIKSDEAANALSHPIADVNNCLNTDETLLQNTNLKGEVQLFKGNKLSLFNNFSKKVRNARGASDLNPIETTTPQNAVADNYGVGKRFWTIGPGNATYKAGDQWVLTNKLLLDVQWAHVGNNFTLDFHDPSLATVQPTFIINSPAGLNGRSGTQQVFLRPENSVTVSMNYFVPGKLGGDHALKVGGYWRDNYSYSNGRTGGNATARFPTATELANPNDCATLGAGCQVGLTRDSQTIYDLLNISAYVQDTITRNRLTLQLGVRYDQNHDQALASSVPASPLMPALLPAVSFAGADPGIVFRNFSPRLGFTYDLGGNGKTLAHANYAMYFGQVGNGGVSSQINPVTAVTVRYQWVDANHDGVVQPGEIYDSKNVLLLAGGNPANFLNESGNWDPANPGSPTTKNTIDPNLKNDRTDEFIVGLDHEVGAGFAVGGNYIWRRYGNFSWSPLNGVSTTGSDYSPVSFTPAASACPSGAACPTLTYYQPNFQLGTISTLMNQQGFNRVFNGVELTARKRLSHRWLMNTSFSYNSTIVNYGSGSYTDPTNITQRSGFQYDYQTSGSGIGNVFVNAKWLYKLSGMYQLPYDVNVSAFYNTRQGYPFERTVTSPTRANGAGTASLLLDNVGDSRLPSFQNLDFRVERPVKLGGVRFVPALDVFNVFNSGTEQAIRGAQNSSNANFIQALVAPRVVRLGVRLQW
jgi:Carboxypeptidase regulatory-like domain/TonB-dependent Receptor Plug Domain